MDKIKFYLLISLLAIIVVGAVFSYLNYRVGEEIAKDLAIAYPAVIAHRGASYLAPESSKPAYLLAKKMGVDYLEADLHRTKDGEIVIFHDDTLKRTTNVEEVFPDRKDNYIEKFTYHELKQLDIGSWFNKRNPKRAKDIYQDLEILTLADLIEIAKGGEKELGLYLETKSAYRYPGIEKEVVEMLAEAEMLGQTIFQSFYLSSLKEFKELAYDNITTWLINYRARRRLGFREILKEADKYQIDGLGTAKELGWPHHNYRINRQGLFIHHYTVNRAWQMRLLNLFGADGFFTDRPELALVTLNKEDEIKLEQLFTKIADRLEEEG